MKRLSKIAALAGIAALVVGFWACQITGSTGTVALHITDAAVDDPAIDGVWITIRDVQYNLGGGEGDESVWQSFEEFVGPQEINLLDYQNGLTFLLGEFALPGGQYNQIRFLLDIPDDEIEPPPTTPGCRVSFNDGTPDAPLFVPSGAQSGYKAVGSFQVPVNGTVNLTADFDLHKSLRLTKDGERYLLQPTIRLVVTDQAGSIEGEVLNLAAEQQLRVFAYADGTYTDTEDDLPPVDIQFPSAVAGAAVGGETQSYRIAFLAAGVYDLVVATVNPDTTLSLAGFVPDVTVESGRTTHQVIDMSGLDTEPDPTP